MQNINQIFIKEYQCYLQRLTKLKNKLKNPENDLLLIDLKKQLEANLDIVNILIKENDYKKFKVELKDNLQEYANKEYNNNKESLLICLLITEQLSNTIEMEQNNYTYYIFDNFKITLNNNQLKCNNFNYDNNPVNKRLICYELSKELNNYYQTIMNNKYESNNLDLLLENIFNFINKIDKFLQK